MNEYKCDMNEYYRQCRNQNKNTILTCADILPHIDKTSLFPIELIKEETTDCTSPCRTDIEYTFNDEG